MARRIGRLLGVAASVLAGVLIASMWIRVVPTQAFGWCVVTDGLSRDEVHARCGLPCGRGDIPKTTDCGSDQPFLTLCSKSCDVYGHTAICYGAGSSEFVALWGHGEPLIRSCGW